MIRKDLTVSIGNDLPSARIPLRWCGLLAVVIVIISGILGMHIVSSGSMAATQMSMEPAAASSDMMPEGDHFVNGVVSQSAADGTTPVEAVFNCPATGHTAEMSMHGVCTPAVGSAALSVPLPGTLTRLGPGAAFLLEATHKDTNRQPDPPSLQQLSISRT